MQENGTPCTARAKKYLLFAQKNKEGSFFVNFMLSRLSVYIETGIKGREVCRIW
jgi:hypothetical protein